MTTNTHPNQPPLYGSLAELLHATRERRGMTKTAAYEDIGTTAMTYRLWTRGQNPDLYDEKYNWLERIANHCEVPQYVVLAALGILPRAEAEIISNALDDIPGSLRLFTANTHRLRSVK